MVKHIKKREGEIAIFNPEKIKNAISKAVYEVHLDTPDNVIESIFSETLTKINKNFDKNIPTIEDIEGLVIDSARNIGYSQVGDAYESYKDKRAKTREILAIMQRGGISNTTDAALLIESDSKESVATWDRKKIAEQLQREANLDYALSNQISKKVENIVVDLYTKGIRKLRTTHVRTLTDILLMQEGLVAEKRKQEILGIPTSDLEKAIFSRSLENSNVANNNPESVNLYISEAILKPFALENVFSSEVREAHLNGAIHLHDLGYIDRVYCSSHSLEYLKKYGLKKLLANLESKSNSPNSAEVLSQHVQTFLASMQMNYAGALGFGFLNIFYAPLLHRPVEVIKGKVNGSEWNFERKDLEKLVEQGEITLEPNNKGVKHFEKEAEKVELKDLPYQVYEQTAQNLIFAASQNAFSRGGQTLFIDFNVHTGVPNYLRNVPAIGPKGGYMIQKSDGSVEMVKEVPRFFNENDPDDSRNGDADQSKVDGRILTYGDFEKSTQKFAKALLGMWQKGDCDGRPFHFPKCDLHIDSDSFADSEQEKIVDYAAQIASEKGAVYFMFDRGDGAILAQCCRLKERITDTSMLKYPEKLRFCGFQNVTVNLAQAAYKGKDLEGTLTEVDKSMELTLKAHEQKRKYIQELLDTDGSPLRSLGKPSDDNTPYLDLEKSTYIIGNIGLNEAVQALTGEQLHESEGAYQTGLKIIAHMYHKIQEFKNRTGLKFTIEETPAESATRRLAKVDLKNFEQAKKVVKGTEEDPYYTNSVHFAPNADISLTDRIVGQSKFHDLIESGAIIHAYIGEKRPDALTIKGLIKKTLENTRCSQLVFSPTYTECDLCENVMDGEKELCTNSKCLNSSEETLNKDTLFPITRVVGYYSRIKNWNGSQQQIYQDRKQAEEFYAGKQGRDSPWLYSPNGYDKLTILQFGKDGCPTCKNLENNVKKQIEILSVGDKIDYKIHYLDNGDEESLVMSSLYNLPLDILPSLVIAGKKDYWAKTTNYSQRNLIKPSEINEEIKRRLGDY